MIKTMRKEKFSSKNKKHRGGFTLVELIVVLVILAILAALLIPALTGYIDKAKKKQVIAETRMLHSAIQTVVAEVYASDEWEEYGKNNGTSSVGVEKYYIAQKGDGAKGERYKEIVRLAEVPSLDDNGKFYAGVTKDGKVMVIIYDDGKGQMGIYFGETQEYVAYDKSEFKSPENFQEIVFYVNANKGGYEYTMYVSKWAILSALGYSGADIPDQPETPTP